MSASGKLKASVDRYVRPLRFVFLSLLFYHTPAVYAQGLYVQTFGDTSSVPLIYLHGGPGYNSSAFEVTTAQKLAGQGYYVIVYDRRGEGRSGEEAAFTFEQTHADLLGMMDSLKLASAHLIGHSFGGMVALTFAEKHMARVRSIVLVGAPVSLQESFKTIIKSCEKLYTDKGDEQNLAYIKMLKKMDTASVQYSSFCFMHAMQNGFYTTKTPTESAQALYALFKTDLTLIEHASKIGYKQPQGFWKNESYTTMDLSDKLSALIEKGTPVFGMYGKEDGLYSRAQINRLKLLLGEGNLLYLDDCSHNVFIDQQETFVEALGRWVK